MINQYFPYRPCKGPKPPSAVMLITLTHWSVCAVLCVRLGVRGVCVRVMRGVVCGCVCHTPTNNRRGIVWLAINRLARPSGSRPTIGLEPACNVSLVNNRETCSRYPRLLPEQVALSSTLCSFSRLEGFTDIDIKLRASPVLPGRGRNLAARAQHPREVGCSNNGVAGAPGAFDSTPPPPGIMLVSIMQLSGQIVCVGLRPGAY